MRRILLRFSLAVLFSIPLLSSAAGIVYFEFAPDPWASQRLTVFGGGTPYQLFQVQESITLTGFDFWVDNTSAANTVNFTLADSQGATLATKSAPLPVLALLPGGYNLHVDLDTPLTLASNATYSIKIDSSATGFGLYYADRISFLEHNQQFTTPYINGVARLGQEEQPFTFKFALFAPTPTGGSGDTPPPPPPSPQVLIISNARVTTTTASTVTLAWTTNVAADSRATVRSQINPLYVVGSNYDPTFELEHAIVITGLNSGADYFADMFSSQGDATLFTTYSVSFRTLAGGTIPNPNPPPTPNPTSTPNPPPNPPPNPNPTSTPNPPPTPPTIDVTPSTGGGGGGTSVKWPSSGSEPSGGYRIDIFDENYGLEKQINVPAGIHGSDLGALADGTHHIIVYANDDELFTKVAPLTSFLSTTTTPVGVSWLLIGFATTLALGTGGYFYVTRKKNNTDSPQEE